MAEEMLNNFMHNVAFLRKTLGLTRCEMEKRLKITTASLEKLENGTMPPKMSMKVLSRIWDAFGIPPKALLNCRLEDEPRKYGE